MTQPSEPQAQADAQYGEELKGTIFPYVDNARHWDIDFNDTSQSYEGSALPPWILGGFAIFVLWSIVYMVIALSA
ncbi:MAG: hypothetical protein U0175_38985 [Caldilineaceae bacterium]